jgi:hypothetical protein
MMKTLPHMFLTSYYLATDYLYLVSSFLACFQPQLILTQRLKTSSTLSQSFQPYACRTLVSEGEKHVKTHKLNNMAKGNEKAMELEIKTLQKHMGGLVKTVLDLKSKVEALEKKPGENLLDEVEKNP